MNKNAFRPSPSIPSPHLVLLVTVLLTGVEMSFPPDYVMATAPVTTHDCAATNPSPLSGGSIRTCFVTLGHKVFRARSGTTALLYPGVKERRNTSQSQAGHLLGQLFNLPENSFLHLCNGNKNVHLPRLVRLKDKRMDVLDRQKVLSKCSACCSSSGPVRLAHTLWLRCLPVPQQKGLQLVQQPGAAPRF